MEKLKSKPDSATEILLHVYRVLVVLYELTCLIFILSVQKKKFFIEPKGNPDPPKMAFYTNHYKKWVILLFLEICYLGFLFINYEKIHI